MIYGKNKILNLVELILQIQYLLVLIESPDGNLVIKTVVFSNSRKIVRHTPEIQRSSGRENKNN